MKGIVLAGFVKAMFQLLFCFRKDLLKQNTVLTESDIKILVILTNPRSKSRLDLGISLKSDFPTTPHPTPTPEKVSNKQERGLQPK